MKIFYSIILSFIFISGVFSAETNKFDYSQSKKVDDQAGAWESKVTHMFFFEDGTALIINFGESSVGYWKFLNKEKTKIQYTWLLENGPWTCEAEIDGDELIRDLGDYSNTYHRIQKERRR